MPARVWSVRFEVAPFKTAKRARKYTHFAPWTPAPGRPASKNGGFGVDFDTILTNQQLLAEQGYSGGRRPLRAKRLLPLPDWLTLTFRLAGVS